MYNISESPAFMEFIQKRAEEIIANDEQCTNLNCEILKLEKELIPLLSPQALEKFLAIDELSIKLMNRICALLQRQFYDKPTILR